MTVKATTTAKKTPAARKPAKAPRKTTVAKTLKRPLRIRPELLPDTATYGTFAGKDYLMIPVEEFGEWYEDITLGAIAQDRLENDDGPALPFEAFAETIEGKGKRKNGK